MFYVLCFMFYVLYKFETEAWKNSEIRGLFHTECFDKYRQEKKSKAAEKNIVVNFGARAERDWIYVKQS